LADCLLRITVAQPLPVIAIPVRVVLLLHVVVVVIVVVVVVVIMVTSHRVPGNRSGHGT
jgi:hypothetical protein